MNDNDNLAGCDAAGRLGQHNATGGNVLVGAVSLLLSLPLRFPNPVFFDGMLGFIASFISSA